MQTAAVLGDAFSFSLYGKNSPYSTSYRTPPPHHKKPPIHSSAFQPQTLVKVTRHFKNVNYTPMSHNIKTETCQGRSYILAKCTVSS